jgi:class 3 adenylate cyclase
VQARERPTTEELVAAGIYDPGDELAPARLELIEYLFGLGATLDELVAAYPNLPIVASNRALRGPGERFTAEEAAARAGVTVDEAMRMWRATGFPDPGPDVAAYTDEDVDVLRAQKLATPGTVLVTGAVRATVDAFAFSWFGECELKGFEHAVTLYEVRRR